MIRKPTGDWRRESAVVTTARSAAIGGASVAKASGHYARGLLCWAFAALWGFCALAAGVSGSLPTFVGVGAMAAFMAWSGQRLFAKARG